MPDKAEMDNALPTLKPLCGSSPMVKYMFERRVVFICRCSTGFVSPKRKIDFEDDNQFPLRSGSIVT